MKNLNRVTLLGRLGRDAEFAVTTMGKPVLKFSLATSETWKGQDGEKKEKTEWHKCVLWGKAAESLKTFLTKGALLMVEGGLTTRDYEKDGVKKFITEVNVRDVFLLSPKKEAGSSAAVAQPAGARHDYEADPMAGASLDEMPF